MRTPLVEALSGVPIWAADSAHGRRGWGRRQAGWQRLQRQILPQRPSCAWARQRRRPFPPQGRGPDGHCHWLGTAGWMTQWLSGKGERDRKRCFPGLAKKCGTRRREFQADGLFYGRVTVRPSCEIIHIDKLSAGFDQWAFLSKISRRSDNSLASSIYCISTLLMNIPKAPSITRRQFILIIRWGPFANVCVWLVCLLSIKNRHNWAIHNARQSNCQVAELRKLGQVLNCRGFRFNN